MSILIVDAVEGAGEEEVLTDVNGRSTLTFVFARLGRHALGATP